MNKSLSAKQKIVLATILNLTHLCGGPPSLEQVRAALKYPSVSSVQRHTDALKRKGYLTSDRGLALSNFSEKVSIPLIGNIAAGTPLLATENIEAYIPYDAAKVRGKTENYFFLQIVGDSMNKAMIDGKSIDDGDFVLVRKQADASIGERVVALIGDEATVKRLSKGDGCVELRPESTNPKNKPIYVFEDLIIQGVVCDVIKKVIRRKQYESE
jgi:repressor LexA